MESDTNYKLIQSNNKEKEKDDDVITGIKLLLKLKHCQKAYDDYVNSGLIDQYGGSIMNNESMYRLMNETIEDESSVYLQKEKGIELDYMNKKSSRMINDVDQMIKEISDTRRQIQLNKDIEKIKTKEDYLAYMNVKPNNVDGTNDACKDQTGKGIERIDNYKNYIITKDNEKEKKYTSIKERLKKQEKEINDRQIESNTDTTNKSKQPKQIEIDDRDGVKYKFNSDDETEKLFEEIRLTNSRMDNFISELDECIELNEKIDKGLMEE